MGSEAHWKRDKNLRDVLVHLYEWRFLLFEWESANISGIDKPFALALQLENLQRNERGFLARAPKHAA